jgi:predicted transcriptional regulator
MVSPFDLRTVTVHTGVMTVRRTVEFDDRLYERIQVLAERERRTINAQIQVLLEQALAQKGDQQ